MPELGLYNEWYSATYNLAHAHSSCRPQKPKKVDYFRQDALTNDEAGEAYQGEVLAALENDFPYISSVVCYLHHSCRAFLLILLSPPFPFHFLCPPPFPRRRLCRVLLLILLSPPFPFPCLLPILCVAPPPQTPVSVVCLSSLLSKFQYALFSWYSHRSSYDADVIWTMAKA